MKGMTSQILSFLIYKVRNMDQKKKNHCNLFKINKAVYHFETIKGTYSEVLPKVLSLSWPCAMGLVCITSFNLPTIL